MQMDQSSRAVEGPLEPSVRLHCPDCGAKVGAQHEEGCDVERCPDCGGQAISCDCDNDDLKHPRLPWTGRWPGDAECREFGWWSRWVGGRGWVQCEATDPGAGPNLNRLEAEGVWDAAAGRFVKPNAGVTSLPHTKGD